MTEGVHAAILVHQTDTGVRKSGCCSNDARVDHGGGDVLEGMDVTNNRACIIEHLYQVVCNPDKLERNLQQQL